MKLSATYTVDVSPQRVFELVFDPAVLQRCIAGCEKLVKTSDDCYDAHLKIGIAGLTGRYVGRVQLMDRQPPESYTLMLDGRGAAGFVRGTSRFRLTPDGPRTVVECEADVQVGGGIAAVGTRLVQAAGKMLMDDFFNRFRAEAARAK